MTRAPPPESNRTRAVDSECFRTVNSERAGILEGSGEHRAVRVERRFELLDGSVVGAAPVFQMPTLRRGESSHVPLAQFSRTRRAFGGRVEPNGEVARVEREGRRCRRAASRSCTVASHTMTVLRVRDCFVPG